MGSVTTNQRGTTSEFFELGKAVPRTIFTGAGDPNSFTFDTDAQPVLGDLFLGDVAFWRFDGADWLEVEGGGQSGQARFPVKILESIVNVPRGQQMTVHGTMCIESTATLEVDGQVVLEA